MLLCEESLRSAVKSTKTVMKNDFAAWLSTFGVLTDENLSFRRFMSHKFGYTGLLLLCFFAFFTSPAIAIAQNTALPSEQVPTVQVTPVRQIKTERPSLSPTTPRPLTNEEKSLVLNEEAVQLTLQGEHEKAISLLEEALKLSEKNTTIRYNVAGLYLTQGKASQAVKVMEEAVLADESDLTLRNRLAEAYLASNELPSAISQYEKIVAVDPSYERALFRLGSLYGMVNQLDQAEATLRRALEVLGEDERTLNSLASVLVVKNKAAEAIPFFEKAYSKMPSAEIAMNLAFAYESLKNLKEALSYLEKAKTLSLTNTPNDPSTNAIIEDHIARIKKILDENKK